LFGRFALFSSVYEVQTYRFANSRHPFSQSKISSFEGILYSLFRFDRQKRHCINGIESQTGNWSKNVLVLKRKVMRAMKSSGSHPLTDNVDVDEFFVGGEEDGKKGRGKAKKKLVVLAIEKRDRGISRMYGKEIAKADAENLGSFMRDTIASNAMIKTDKWSGYKPLKKDFENLIQLDSGKKGGNFPEIHRVIMMFKSWLRGIHHNVNDLQTYIDEYTYRFNRHFMKASIFDNLILRMINSKPYYLCT